LLEARGAVQLGLVGRFDAGLADVVRAAVVGPDAVFFQLRLVLRIDAAEIAERMRADVAEGVLAEKARLDLDALEAKAIGGELRHLLVREPVAQRQVLGVAGLLQQLPEADAVAVGDVDVLGELVDRALEVPYPARKDLER